MTKASEVVGAGLLFQQESGVEECLDLLVLMSLESNSSPQDFRRLGTTEPPHEAAQ
jgi:hypothetical protein